MARKRSAIKRKHRPKLDARLGYLASLPNRELVDLCEREVQRCIEVEKQVGQVLAQDVDVVDEAFASKLSKLADELTAPITTGVHVPGIGPRNWPLRLREPYVSVFIDSDAGARDLRRLGARVRNKVCDVFTAFVLLSDLPKLEATRTVRAIELARPLVPDLNQAVPYTQVNQLQAGPPATTGANVVVGVVDSLLDVYHPDFRTAAGQTRVLFLWDQGLVPVAGEAGPPVAPALPGFQPAGGTYGVDYTQANINAELAQPAGTPPYQIVRHGGAAAAHGTHVTGIAAGNGLAQAPPAFVGGAPASNIIFVASAGSPATALFADSAFVADAFAYIFARAAQLGRGCVINLSASDNQGPHDGTTLGERFLDGLLNVPRRAMTFSAGNSTGTACHTSNAAVGVGAVVTGGTVNLVLSYVAPPAGGHFSDDVEIWYDGQDRFSVTVTPPGAAAIGPVAPGAAPVTQALPGGVTVTVTSIQGDPRNGDNLISIIINVPFNQTITGNWTIALTGTTVVNGAFQAWVDRNNRGFSAWQAPDETQLTLGVPATCRRAITVGNHTKAGPPPAISGSSGRGPSRDGRIKPEIATVGTNVTATRSRNMASAAPGGFYIAMTGTSMSAPLVAGACALLFQCRGAATTWVNLLQLLEDTAGTVLATPPGPPNNTFGFGFMQIGGGCTFPVGNVDVWLRDDPLDSGIEPFTGPVAWLSPDIEVLDTAGNVVPNPKFNATNRFNNLVRVTVRNRGGAVARNTEVHLSWADPATNIPFPAAWNATGIFAGGPPNFPDQTNRIVIPAIPANGSQQVVFAWAPPAPGSNIRGDDHFCLLVRLENAADPSQIGGGTFAVIAARNNIALKNVHVLPNDTGGDAVTGFYVVGTGDQDTLVITPELARGEVALSMPTLALPWREARVLDAVDCPRPRYGDPGQEAGQLLRRRTLKAAQVEERTDVIGARRLELTEGIATIVGDARTQLVVPCVQIAEGAKMPVALAVRRLRTDEERRSVHVAQYSAGELVGGVTLELRKGLRDERRARVARPRRSTTQASRRGRRGA